MKGRSTSAELNETQGQLDSVIAGLRNSLKDSLKFFEHDEQNGVYLFRLMSFGTTEREWSPKLFGGLFYSCECIDSILSDDFRPTVGKVYEIIIIEPNSIFAKSRCHLKVYEIIKPLLVGVMPKEAMILLLHFLALPENKEIKLPFVTIARGVIGDSIICYDFLVANFKKTGSGKSMMFPIPSGLNEKNWDNYANMAFCLK